MNIFERAARDKVRFPSGRGELNTEQLWDLHLDFLDIIARGINAKLKSVTEESFIEKDPDPRKDAYGLQLDILKHIIAAKLDAAKAAEEAKMRAAKRRKLIDALGAKEDEELGKKSKTQLLKELEELD